VNLSDHFFACAYHRARVASVVSAPIYIGRQTLTKTVSLIGLQLRLQGTCSLNRLRAILNDLRQSVKTNV